MSDKSPRQQSFYRYPSSLVLSARLRELMANDESAHVAACFCHSLNAQRVTQLLRGLYDRGFLVENVAGAGLKGISGGGQRYAAAALSCYAKKSSTFHGSRFLQFFPDLPQFLVLIDVLATTLLLRLV